MLNIMKSRLSAAKAGFAGNNLSFLFVALFLLQLTTFAQTKWFKYAGNPVLEKGATGEWDAASVNNQRVFWDGTKYIMWYSGNNIVSAIGYATSTDGITWEKYAGNPVLEIGAPGSWDAGGVWPGPVLFDGTLYKMWYDGGAGGVGMIGLATSPDGINWTKDTINSPVLTPTSGSWDAAGAWSDHVIYENSIYKMWYNGGAFNNNLGATVYKLGYAESDDGITWTKHPGPVMEEGDFVTWANDLFNPFVINDGNNYMMWYASINTLSGSGEQINYATSPDGLVWTKFEDNPVLSPGISLAWDNVNIWKPEIIRENNLYKMWYTGMNNQERRIGYAEDFSNLVHADSVIIEKPYVKPNTDPLNILGQVISPEGHALTAKAIILSDDGSIQDSVELFDDGLNGDGDSGDGIYGGYLPVTDATEINYTVGIKTVDLVTGFTRNGLNWNITDRFTTIGPLVVVDYLIVSNDTIPNPGDQIRFKIELRNNGLTTTAVDIKAVISTTDSSISEITGNSTIFGDIPAGESVFPASGFQKYTVEINPNSPGNIDVWFNVDIYSEDNLFWSDSFAFHIDSTVTAIADEENFIPDKYALHQNYPNPFNPSTTIEFSVPVNSNVTLTIYNSLGQVVTTLVNEEISAGNYSVIWNGTDKNGLQVSSGVYLYKMQANGNNGNSYGETKKMILLK